jgi:ATP-binding cassette subfamily B multidrug efflux pump
VIEFLDADEQSAEPVDAGLPPTIQGRVEFCDVTFSYDPDRALIESLSLQAEPGQTVAIVGPTGAGKTTLVNLIMRFYELNSGMITLDGRDISTIERDELRSKIGMVLQDTWLFGGTIRENIARFATTSNTAIPTRPRSRCSRPRGRRMSIASCTRCPTGTTR